MGRLWGDCGETVGRLWGDRGEATMYSSTRSCIYVGGGVGCGQ